MPAANLIVTGADDPSTMSFSSSLPASTSTPPSPEKLFNSEWDSAQSRYRAAVNQGYSEADAAQLYLDPVKNKWDILKDVPETMKRAAAAELDQAQQAFVQGAQSGYKASDAENIYLKPAEQKWSAAAKIPATDPNQKAKDEKEIAGYLDSLRVGYDPNQVMQDVPERLWKIPGFEQQWVASASVGQRKRAAEAAVTAKEKAVADAKEQAAQDPEKYLSQTAKYAAQFKLPIPQATLDEAQKMLGSRTNFPAIGAQPPVSFQPPAPPAVEPPLDVQPGGGNRKYATKYRNPAEVTAAFSSKELTRDEAKKILQDQFGYK